MDDSTPKAVEPAEDSAGDTDQTEEQLWAELDAEDKGEPDAEPEGQDPEGEAEGEAWGKDPDSDDEAEAEGTSEDDEGEGGSASAPDGTDPEALRAQNERLQQSFKSEQGRARALQRKIRRLEAEIDSAEKSPQSDQDEATLADRKKKLEEVQSEYGDVVGPVLDQINSLEKRFDSLTAKEQQALEERRSEYNELVMAEQSVFESEHPDGFEVIEKNSDTFTSWIEDQPKYLRDLFSENQQVIVNGAGAALLVGKFKEALLSADGGSAPANQQTQRLQNRRQQQLAGARSERTPNRQAASSRPSKDSDDPEAHWDYFERMEKRR